MDGNGPLCTNFIDTVTHDDLLYPFTIGEDFGFITVVRCDWKKASVRQRAEGGNSECLKCFDNLLAWEAPQSLQSLRIILVDATMCQESKVRTLFLWEPWCWGNRRSAS